MSSRGPAGPGEPPPATLGADLETGGPSHEAVTDVQAGRPSYEAATARVEEIIRRLDSGEASLNETLSLVKEGKTLIELCAGELEAVGNALEELRLDELVSRLEGEGQA
jgi:exodeoxyribonuclease VII small subunit